MFKKFILWLVQSSENPSQVSLTIKGVMLAAIPTIVGLTGFFFHITLPTADLANDANAIVLFAQSGLTAIGAGIAAYGLIRKLINTYFIPWPTDASVVAAIGAPKA